MAEFEHALTVRATAGQVFAFVADVRSIPDRQRDEYAGADKHVGE